MGRCIQRGPNLSALRTPGQLGVGWGGFQRKSPIGGSPNGMPLKLRIPELLSETPSSVPLAILTRSWASAPAVKVMADTIARIKSRLRFVGFIGLVPFCFTAIFMWMNSHRDHRDHREAINSLFALCALCG